MELVVEEQVQRCRPGIQRAKLAAAAGSLLSVAAGGAAMIEMALAYPPTQYRGAQ